MGRVKTNEERLGKRWAKKNLPQREGNKISRADLGFEGLQGQSKQQLVEHIGKGRIRQKV